MSVQRGDVVIVDYPFSDRTGSKVRPALVVQADAWTQRLADTILALISSSRQRFVGAQTRLVIDPSKPDGQRSGLRQPSVVQCENLVTLDQSLILRTIGGLSPALLRQIDDCLKAELGLP